MAVGPGAAATTGIIPMLTKLLRTKAIKVLLLRTASSVRASWVI